VNAEFEVVFMIARFILLGFGVTVLIIAIRRMRAYRLKERHMLIFLFTGLPFLALSIWPTAVGWVALKMHVQYQTVGLLCVAGFFILVIFELLTIVSLQDRKISALAQIVGILMEKHGMSDRLGAEGKAFAMEGKAFAAGANPAPSSDPVQP
jgi:small-conductance mechanosensitive channel